MTQQERQARSRAEILQAALAEFSVRDFDQVSTEGICSRHGISKGMMYHYYAGKDALFLLCVEDTFTALRQYVEQEAAKLPAQSAAERIKHYFLLRERFFQAHPERTRIFENAMLRPPEHLREQIQALRAPLRRLNEELLHDVIRSMRLRPGLRWEQVIRYLESAEPVFRSVALRYQADRQAQDLHTMLAAAEEVLDMALFGIFCPEAPDGASEAAPSPAP